jgi:hypothetical protein
MVVMAVMAVLQTLSFAAEMNTDERGVGAEEKKAWGIEGRDWRDLVVAAANSAGRVRAAPFCSFPFLSFPSFRLPSWSPWPDSTSATWGAVLMHRNTCEPVRSERLEWLIG